MTLNLSGKWKMESRTNFTLSGIATYIVLTVGVFLRFYHLFKIDFHHEPFRLGGLFVAFSEQIIQNGFRLPHTIPYYSLGGIPFAYPPLGFYVEAICLSLFPNRYILIANVLPPLISAISVVAVYLLLRWHYVGQEAYILAGTFAYAFLPPAFTNQIEAAGLAEAFGSLALVFFFYCVIRFHSVPVWRNAALIGFALGISILSSPGSAIGVAFLCGLVGLETFFKSKNIVQSIGQTSVLFLTGALVSAPYWATVMLNHGRGIFIAPVLAQYNGGGHLGYFQALAESLLKFMVVQDGAAFFWNLLIFLGILWHISQGKWALPLAFLALFSIPREAVWLIALPAALLFAHGFVDVLLNLMPPSTVMGGQWKGRVYLSFLVIVGFGMAFQAFTISDALVADRQWKITADQIRLVKDARALIPANAKVLVMGNDALLEWSPYLLQREVINTKFGLEWKPGDLQAIALLNGNISEAKTWDEVQNAVVRFTGGQPVYVLSEDKKLLTALNRNSTVPFRLKVETPAIQLGVLGAP